MEKKSKNILFIMYAEKTGKLQETGKLKIDIYYLFLSLLWILKSYTILSDISLKFSHFTMLLYDTRKWRIFTFGHWNDSIFDGIRNAFYYFRVWLFTSLEIAGCKIEKERKLSCVSHYITDCITADPINPCVLTQSLNGCWLSL